MLAQDGIFIYFPENTNNKKPIQIINLLLDNKGFFYNTRNLIIIEKNASANIVFCDDSLSVNEFLGNNVTEIFIGENASLDYYRIQNEHNENNNISSIYIHQSKNSRLHSGVYSLLGGLIRNNFNIKLTGEGCESELYGLSLIDKKQHTDNNVFVEHAAPNCNSRQLFKSILDDNATGAFSGKVLVNQNAQQTNAEQTNKNILLTNDAKMNTMPQLVIYADDVKCSHGATVGQLDEEAMFYMRARGITQKDARMLLMYAFASEVIKPVKINALRENIEDLAQRRLNGELALCRNCAARVVSN
jgi:Fe-S cluster assembly protein SufD